MTDDRRPHDLITRYSIPMYPVLFQIGDFVVTSFGLMMALSFLAGGWILSRELKHKGEDPELGWEMVWYAAVGGILGAKLYYMFLNWESTVADPWGAILSRGGLVWYGGFIGGALAVLWRLRRANLPILRIADAAAPALILGYAVGRLGCFLVGDDYGHPTDLPWGVRFPDGAPPSTAANLRNQFGVEIPAGVSGDTVLAVHPTQLYEVAMALLIFAVLWKLRTRLLPAGTLFFLYVALSGVERFIVEIFRAKDDRFFGVFTLAQLISMVLVLVGVAAAARLISRGAPDAGAPVPPRPASPARQAR